MKSVVILFAILVCLPSLLSYRDAHLGGGKYYEDACLPLKSCEICIKEHLCGWCSTPVIGGNGAQCAGFANGSSPFICVGTYQTTTCLVPTTGGASSGPTPTTTATTSSTTGSSTTGPSPGPPVTGFWRGLQVNQGYKSGEWNFTFSEKGVVVYGPEKKYFKGDSFSSSNQLDIKITDGDDTGETVYGIFEIGQGPATHFFTYAISPAGATLRPSSWGIAMKNNTYTVWTLTQPKDF